jgi:putative hemolysin
MPIRVDIDEILDTKAPKISRKIPRFVKRYLKRVAHQDDINEVFRRFGQLKGADFAKELLRYLDITVKYEGLENLPQEGVYTFVSNHPLGGLDGVAIAALLGKRYPLKIMVNDLLMYVEPLNDVFMPINMGGKQGKASAETINKYYASDDTQIVMFPAGQVSRKQKGGKIEDGDWKKNFIVKTVAFKRDVVPMYFEGFNSKFFYNLARVRKFLKIKINIEMLYLADELFGARGKTFTIKIGKPIAWQTFDNTKSQNEWAKTIRKEVYKMS